MNALFPETEAVFMDPYAAPKLVLIIVLAKMGERMETPWLTGLGYAVVLTGFNLATGTPIYVGLFTGVVVALAGWASFGIVNGYRDSLLMWVVAIGFTFGVLLSAELYSPLLFSAMGF